ncbi:MAG: hypothetical protein IPK92_18370 [Nitrospira sp.]|nr:hypothetical protein [Nitrospira sp.]MBL8054022.1 hypothetical protein [Nitrospira sp.]
MAIMDPLIREIDRILIHTQDVERVFARFRHEFGLPVAWPLVTVVCSFQVDCTLAT